MLGKQLVNASNFVMCKMLTKLFVCVHLLFQKLNSNHDVYIINIFYSVLNNVSSMRIKVLNIEKYYKLQNASTLVR